MEREILFRGKRIDNGKWVYGYYIKLKSCDETLHIIVDEHGEYHRIMPNILEQYIELTDKNGVKIFEGDILKRNEAIYEVKYSTEQVRFLAILSNGIFNPAVFQNCEVIGNIHDNPELLGDKR
ncbi:MAG: YopX family protein [Ruminococcus sp.]|nr:YopX family protein [Ruminococcus sp.]